MVCVNPNGVRRFRRTIQAACRAGRYPLRVVGSEAEGFRVGGERGQTVILFGPTFERQRRAVAFGRLKCRQRAVKLVGGSIHGGPIKKNRQAA